MKTIDLRSDTVTHPTPAMREAMYRAEVGDDCYSEDPTVNRLQELAAERMGMEAALFMPSGLMANLAAILAHCRYADEIILGYYTDMFQYEVGSYAAVGGIHPHPLPNQPDGTIALDDIERAIRAYEAAREEVPRTALICLENTNMLCGGVSLTPGYMASVRALADRYSIPIHLDGARIFNAAIALGIDVKALTKGVDSVMFCLSKGLACPIGSVLCGSKDMIHIARHRRKMLGGHMRQAGIVAAAGVVALEQMVDRLADDHRNARLLAEGLNEIKGLSVDLDKVHTNMVFINVTADNIKPGELVAKLAEEGVKILPLVSGLRAVTHYGIEEKDIKTAISIMRRVVEGG
jgi:threonine aldolase